MMHFVHLRSRIIGLVPVLACALLAPAAVKADPPATPGTRAAALSGRTVSTTALTVASASGNGNAVVLVATVNGNGTTPAGSVVFTLQGKRIGEVPVSNGAASMTVSTLPTGPSSLAASFQGDKNLRPSTSATIRFYQDEQD